MEMFRIREALEASWKPDTAYLEVHEDGNPARGQCYPTARVIQHFFPSTEIVEGDVWTGKSTEKHFWNILDVHGSIYHLDFSWQQFPKGSTIKSFEIRDRTSLGDGTKTIQRVNLLLKRVTDYLALKD